MYLFDIFYVQQYWGNVPRHVLWGFGYANHITLVFGESRLSFGNYVNLNFRPFWSASTVLPISPRSLRVQPNGQRSDLRECHRYLNQLNARAGYFFRPHVTSAAM